MRIAVPIPVVSATETSSTPISSKALVMVATFEGGTSGPSYGQPSATDTYPRTRIPWDLASETIGLHRFSDSCIVQLVFALENASVAAAKSDISVVNEGEDDPVGCVGSFRPEVVEDISFGSWVDVMGDGSSCDSLPRFG